MGARGSERWFAWQASYAIVSFGEKNLTDVVAYVDNQEARRARDRLWERLDSSGNHPQPPNGVSSVQRGIFSPVPRPTAAQSYRSAHDQ